MSNVNDSITAQDADEFYWANAINYPNLDGEQINNGTHRDIMRLAADFANHVTETA